MVHQQCIVLFCGDASFGCWCWLVLQQLLRNSMYIGSFGCLLFNKVHATEYDHFGTSTTEVVLNIDLFPFFSSC